MKNTDVDTILTEPVTWNPYTVSLGCPNFSQPFQGSDGLIGLHKVSEILAKEGSIRYLRNQLKEEEPRCFLTLRNLFLQGNWRPLAIINIKHQFAGDNTTMFKKNKV